MTVYAQAYNAEHDWLVATLHEPLGSEYGFFGIRNWSASIEGYEATVSGYPTNSEETISMILFKRKYSVQYN